MEKLYRIRQEPAQAAGRRWLQRSRVSAAHRMARSEQIRAPGGKASEEPQIQFADSRHQRLHPQQPNLSGRNVQNFSPGENSRKSYFREQRFRGGLSGSEPARVGVRSDYLSVQGLRLNGCLYATGPAPAIRTTLWDRSTIGWRKSIHVGARPME